MKPIVELLRIRYPEESYALFTEVRNATGFSGDRSADAVAMCLYPSRGLEVMGFEFKASRNDWLRELKNPRKAEGVCSYCDRWWVVAGKGIVKPEELPKTWGLLVTGEEALRAAVVAPPLEPCPMDRKFTASLLRAAQKAAAAPAKELEERIRNELFKAQVERDQKNVERAESDAAVKVRELERMIDEFEKASGVQLRNPWDAPRIGQAVKLLVETGGHLALNLERSADLMTRVAESARAAAAEIKAMGVAG